MWRRTKPEVSARPAVYDFGDPRVRELFHEFAIPYGFANPVFLSTDIGAPFPAALALYLPPDVDGALTDRGLGLLRLLLPAYKAGIQHCVHLARQRRVLGRLIDALPDGVGFCDVTGRVAHQNPALAVLLRADAEAARIAAENTAAASVGAIVERRRLKSAPHAPPEHTALREVRTARARYRLHASYVGPELLGRTATVVVLVGRLRPQQLTADALRARYGLSAREIQVADLLGLEPLECRPRADDGAESAHGPALHRVGAGEAPRAEPGRRRRQAP
jgi:hypothetical protein